jgi:hypothetical protein
MCSLLVKRIIKHSQAPKCLFLPSTIVPIQKSFLSNVTALEDAYQDAKAYCKGDHVFLVLYHKL